MTKNHFTNCMIVNKPSKIELQSISNSFNNTRTCVNVEYRESLESNEVFLKNKRKKANETDDKTEKKNMDSFKIVDNFTRDNFTLFPTLNNNLIGDEIKIRKDPEKLKQLNIDNFRKNYLKFIENNQCNFLKKKLSFFEENLSDMYEIYEYIKENKGFKEMIGYNLFENFVREKRIFRNPKEAREIVNNYLFHFLEYEEERKRCPKSNPEDILNSIIYYNPSFVNEVPIIYAPDDLSELNKKIENSFKYDLVILRGFLPKFGLDNKYLNKEYLLKYHGKKKIDVVEQDPKFEGFSTNKHILKSMLLKEYIEYINSVEQQPSLLDNTNLIKYAVNIDLDQFEDIQSELESKIDPLIMCRSNNDLLSYLRQGINGMSCAQMYLKVKGVWTGGHEENLRFRSININHGPGSSDWYGVAYENSQKFREVVKEKEQIDIYTKEGVWFPNIKYFMEKKINVLYTVQQPGDIVLVGAGCLHWVRSRGHSINTSWNFGTKDKIQIESSIQRYKINKEIKFRSLVPMVTLLIDFLNHELWTTNIEIVVICEKFLKEAKNKELFYLNEFINTKTIKSDRLFKEPEHYLINSCESCFEEIFNHWAYCNACSKNKKEGIKQIFCVKCINIHLKGCKDKKKIDLIYKYEKKDLRKFFQRIEMRINKNSEYLKNPSLFKNNPQMELIKTKNNNNIDYQNFIEKDKSAYSSLSLSLQKARELIPTNKVLKNLLPLLDNNYETNVVNISQEDYIDLNTFEDLNYNEEEKLKFSPCYIRKTNNTVKHNFL